MQEMLRRPRGNSSEDSQGRQAGGAPRGLSRTAASAGREGGPWKGGAGASVLAPPPRRSQASEAVRRCRTTLASARGVSAGGELSPRGGGALDLLFLRARGRGAPSTASAGAGIPVQRAASRRKDHQNPMNGSGPRGREARGEETAGGVRNPVGGTCRVRQTRVKRTLEPMSLKGRTTPRGEVRGLRASGRRCDRTLGERPNPWEAPRAFGPGKLADGRPRGRGNGEEGAAKPMCRYVGRWDSVGQEKP